MGEVGPLDSDSSPMSPKKVPFQKEHSLPTNGWLYGGLYATYHLLGEPETTIDPTSIFQGLYPASKRRFKRKPGGEELAEQMQELWDQECTDSRDGHMVVTLMIEAE